MRELILGLVMAVLGLLGFGVYKSHKLDEQKTKTQEAEAKAEIREKQMEVVHEVRKQLNIIETEKPPEKMESPAAGDSGSRLERLNKLHKH
ncbi:MAG: hypothetical protein II883_07185 [Spirochaetales bacterium]|nr:hypothetical protein [Spirochaetales bacterium]